VFRRYDDRGSHADGLSRGPVYREATNVVTTTGRESDHDGRICLGYECKRARRMAKLYDGGFVVIRKANRPVFIFSQRGVRGLHALVERSGWCCFCPGRAVGGFIHKQEVIIGHGTGHRASTSTVYCQSWLPCRLGCSFCVIAEATVELVSPETCQRQLNAGGVWKANRSLGHVWSSSMR
jgi:hypothetical protein